MKKIILILFALCNFSYSLPSLDPIDALEDAFDTLKLPKNHTWEEDELWQNSKKTLRELVGLSNDTTSIDTPKTEQLVVELKKLDEIYTKRLESNDPNKKVSELEFCKLEIDAYIRAHTKTPDILKS